MISTIERKPPEVHGQAAERYQENTVKNHKNGSSSIRLRIRGQVFGVDLTTKNNIGSIMYGYLPT